jgi:hypothetical protein
MTEPNSFLSELEEAPRQVAMTDERPGMSIALDADAFEQNEALALRLAEAMLAVAGEACDPCCRGRRGLEIGPIAVHTLVQPVHRPAVPRCHQVSFSHVDFGKSHCGHPSATHGRGQGECVLTADSALSHKNTGP